MDMYTLLSLKWVTNEDLLSSTWNSAQCYVAAWRGGAFGGEWIHVYVRLSPFAVYMQLSQQCPWLCPTQSKKLFKKKREKAMNSTVEFEKRN